MTTDNNDTTLTNKQNDVNTTHMIGIPAAAGVLGGQRDSEYPGGLAPLYRTRWAFPLPVTFHKACNLSATLNTGRGHIMGLQVQINEMR